MKYRARLIETVEAIGFEELVAYGTGKGATLTAGMPWSFDYRGVHVTHENDNCYLVGSEKFERGQYLVTADKLDAVPVVYGSENFHYLFEPVPEAEVIPPMTSKECLIATAKRTRQRLDAVLQDMKQQRAYLIDPDRRTKHAEDHEDHSEAIANQVLAIRDVESAIMRLGMVLKCTGNPNPYPQSYNPASPVVEPTADNLKL